MDFVRKEFEKVGDTLTLYFQSRLDSYEGIHKLVFKVFVDLWVLEFYYFFDQIYSEPHISLTH